MNINQIADLKGKTVKVDGFTVTIAEVIFAQAMWLIFDQPVDRGNPDLATDWQSVSIWDQADADRVELI